MSKQTKYSVLMSVYKNEKVDFFVQAIESVLNQTAAPDQIVLVRDGLVYDELQRTIDEYVTRYPDLFTYLPLEKNGGLGNALRYGLTYCRNELIGRMDTDDISILDRFEQQVKYMEENPNVDIVGGNISEFYGSPDQIVQYRVVYQTHEEIAKDLGNRSPFNHVTVMFKKESVLKAGNYEDFYQFEDWFLWVKMFLSGCKFANLNENLVNVRILDMSSRRGGVKYYKSCKKLLRFMKKNRIIGFFKYLKVKTIRFIGYVLLPKKLLAFLYKKMLRKTT